MKTRRVISAIVCLAVLFGLCVVGASGAEEKTPQTPL